MTGHMHVSTAIMTHPARQTDAERLRDAHPELDAVVVVDPNPQGPRTGLRTARLAWAAAAPNATHHLVLQDDVIVPPRFADELHRAVTARPRDALSLFSEWGSRSTQAARIAALTGAPWVTVMADYVPAQALVLPATTARGLAAFLETECTDYEHDDAAIHRYLARSGVEALLAVVNIVDHLDVPSLHGSGHDSWGPRPSGCFLPDPAERTDFPDWTGNVLRPEVVPYLPRVRYLSRPLCLVRCPSTGDWRSWPAIEYLWFLGSSSQQVMTALLAALQAGPGGARLQDEVGLGILHDLWLVGCLIGVGLRCALPGLDACGLRSAMTTSVARRSLATAAGGGLRDRLNDDTLTRLAPAFEEFVRHAVRFGATSTVLEGT
jgi:hypothetical protein